MIKLEWVSSKKKQSSEIDICVLSTILRSNLVQVRQIQTSQLKNIAKPHLMYLRTSLKDGSIMLNSNDDVDIDYDTVESQIAYTLVSIKEHVRWIKLPQ